MHNYLRTRSFLFLLSAWALAAVSNAQQSGPDLGPDKEAIAGHWSKIHRADSVGDALVAARTRITLAPMVKPAQARKLYAEAALIADTARLAADEGLRAHQGLMELQRAAGNWRGAFEEARTVIALTEEWNERQAQIAEELQRIEIEKSVGRQDSLQRALAEQAQLSERSVAAERAVADRWRWTSVLLALVAIVILVGIVLAARRERKRTLTEQSAVRAELDQIRAALATKPVEPTAPVAPPLVVPILAEQPVVPIAEGPDDVVLGMFRAQAPGRLEALRQARANADHAKVVRVVHTLKPQLVHIDAERFTTLCAALTGAEASEQLAQWNADLDRFETEVGALLH